MTVRAYIDASAYLAVLLGEKNSQIVLSIIKGKELCSNSLLAIEVERTLINATRRKIISIDNFEIAMAQLNKDVDRFLLCDLTIDLCLTLNFPTVRTPRTLDLIHLRTAYWFMRNGGLAEFVSLDDKQRGAAQEMLQGVTCLPKIK